MNIRKQYWTNELEYKIKIAQSDNDLQSQHN